MFYFVEAHVIHIVDGVVHRLQCFLVVSVGFRFSWVRLFRWNWWSFGLQFCFTNL